MSSVSAVTDEFLHQKKLAVHVAENGHSFEFMCDGSTSVEEIQQSIESLYGILRSNQLLFCRNLSLDPHQTLGYYKLPQEDCEVFVYKKSSFHSDSPPPPLETIEFPNSPDPPNPSSVHTPHPLDNAADPALKALASYEKLFRYHFQLANSVYGRAQSKLEICKRLLREQQVQERALEAVRGNVELTFLKLHQRYNEFLRCYSTQHRCHSEVLSNLGRDIEKLQATKLHPSLQLESRKCLLDFVKEDLVRKWASDCAALHQSFEAKVVESKADFGELKSSVENVLSGMAPGGGKKVESAVLQHQKMLNNLNSIMQSLSKDVDTVKKHADECLSCQSSASVQTHDAISGLGRIYNSHESDQLPRVRNCDHAMTKLLEMCKSKKNDMTHLVHMCMQRVKSVQISIKDMFNQLHGFQEVIGRQEKDFESLKYVNGLSHAYRACLAEIVRRKSYLKLYMGLAGQLAERLATEREAEIRRREDFQKNWGKYMNFEVLSSMGLLDSPRQCDINIAPFDTDLLDIDVMDFDRFQAKSTKSESPRSSVEVFGEADCLTKSKENTDYDSGRNDLCEAVDIAGTSKIEVENTWLKAELASAIAVICSYDAEVRYETLDDDKRDNVLKNLKEKTAEALGLKDEYVKHLRSMLERKQDQCISYETRIQELEQRLSGQFDQLHKLSGSKDGYESTLSALKVDSCKSQIFGDAQIPDSIAEAMDDASFTSVSLCRKTAQISDFPGKSREGGDENMSDLSGSLHMLAVDSERNVLDSSMLEPFRDERATTVVEECLGGGEHREDMANSSSNDPRLNMQACGSAKEPTPEAETTNDFVLNLQKALAEKTMQFKKAESQLKANEEEIISMKRELEISHKLLKESQMNCAHLENCLHEAREEAHTNLCASDRRASEYNSLRTTAIKLRSLFERFRSCVASPVAVAGFADSLRSLAVFLASSASEDEDDASAEFRACIRILADKVGVLTRHRAELLDRCSRSETAHGHLLKELEEKKELVKSLYTKHQMEKQASKEKISFGYLEVHELAAFVLNSSGHYEAINSNSSKYFLSPESVALFADQQAKRPPYIIGQIVHIERQSVRPPPSDQEAEGGKKWPPSAAPTSSPNLYNLPLGCEYFIVTIAMIPDTIRSSASSS